MRTKLKLLKRKIVNSLKGRNFRIASVLLVLVLVMTGIISSFMGSDSGAEVQADVQLQISKYLDYVVQNINELNNDENPSNDKDFTVLEVVPYKGVGEFYHYIENEEVYGGLNEYLLENDSNYVNNAVYKFTKLTEMSNFVYNVMYCKNEQSYKFESSELFLKYIIPDYAYILRDHISVNVCEANDLTPEMVEKADLIIVNTGIHDGQTISGYNMWSGNTGTNCYDVNGNEVSDGNISYSTYEDVTDIVNTPEGATLYTDREKIEITDGSGNERILVSRDASWEAASALLEVCLEGRTFNINGTEMTLKTPVIMDNQKFGQLAGTYNDSNIYKFMVLKRLIGEEEKGYLARYADIKAGFVYDDTNPVYNQLGVRTAELKFKNSGIQVTKWTLDTGSSDSLYYYFEDYHLGESEYYKDIYNNGMQNSIFKHYYSYINDIKGIDAKVYAMYSPNNAVYLTDSFWIYDGSSVLIPANFTSTYTKDNEKNGFIDERIGDASNVEVGEVIRFLLGTNPSVASGEVYADRPLKILEIEPCNQFKYDTFESVVELATAMRYDTSKWTAENYTDYIEVVCLSTNAFNSLNEDLIAEYDVIYMGLEYDETMTVSGSTDSFGNAVTNYNDNVLDGYVYLAYGDLMKVSNNLQGAMEFDYLELPARYYRTATDNGFTLVGLTGDDGERTNGILDYYRLYMTGTYKWNNYLNEKLPSGKYYILKDVNEVFSGVSDVNTLLANELGNMRFMGNDITQKKLEELLEYQSAGKVFIVDDYLYYYKGNDYIYETSNMYKIVQSIGWDAYGKAYRSDSCYEVPEAVEKVVPEIVFSEYPTDVEYGNNGVIKNSNPDQNKEEEGYQMRFTFAVEGEANTAYMVKMGLDKNGDGLYDFVKKIDDTNELYAEDIIVLNSEGIYEEMEVEITLPTELTGPIAWKVQVTKLENGEETAVRMNKTGYTAIQGPAKDVKVLQIYPSGGQIPIRLNMETNETFDHYLDLAADAIGFNIDIDAISTEEYEEIFEKDRNYRISEHYDMVVIGFADAFGGDDISNNHGALDAIEEFITSGGATLFTHDTTSFITTPNYVVGTRLSETTGYINTSLRVVGDGDYKKYDWSYNLNYRFRNILGQDKYGITLSDAERAAESIEPPLYLSEVDAPDYVTAKNGNYYVQEIQGITDLFILRYRYMTSVQWYSWTWPYQSMNTWTYQSSKSYTSYGQTETATKINDGQITQYPYVIDDDITVAKTHAQNYALNLEKDKDGEDIVVWYTLAFDENSESGASNGIYYDVTDKDGAQNYYIYSKANITYSGAGHSAISSEQEIKLFVNTVIRAATSGNSVPTIAIDNGNKANDGSYVIYRNELEDEYDIVFTPKDTDLLSGYGKFVSGRIAYRNTVTGEEKVLRTYGDGGLICGNQYSISITEQDIIDAIDRKEAEFVFEVTDTYGATGQTIAVFSVRHLFELD